MFASATTTGASWGNSPYAYTQDVVASAGYHDQFKIVAPGLGQAQATARFVVAAQASGVFNEDGPADASTSIWLDGYINSHRLTPTLASDEIAYTTFDVPVTLNVLTTVSLEVQLRASARAYPQYDSPDGSGWSSGWASATASLAFTGFSDVRLPDGTPVAYSLEGYHGGGFLPQDALDTLPSLTHMTPGDATLDGIVNFDDLLVLAQHYGQASDGQWTVGDFDSDGSVGFDDLLALAQNYGHGQSLVAPNASSDFQKDWARALAMVPEPTSLSLLALGGLTLARHRRA